MAIAVFDIGKTTLKLGLFSQSNEQLFLEGAENRPVRASHYSVPDVKRTWEFLLGALGRASRRANISDIIVSGHGSSGYLINSDTSTTPLPDYESELPADVEALYAAEADCFEERGSGIAQGATHLAKQLLWLETKHSSSIANAETLLPAPQYWAWRLSGERSAEPTGLTAQSHLWNAQEARPSSIVGRRAWTRLMPPIRNAADSLGVVLPEVSAILGLRGDTKVYCGVHDSTANFYRFEAAGFENFALLSTGTWLVTMSDLQPVMSHLDRDITRHTSASGRAAWSVRAMAGREFDILSDYFRGEIDVGVINEVLASRSMALPSFGSKDGIVHGSAGRGRIVGRELSTSIERAALALLYFSMLADLSLETFPDAGPIIVDGNITQHQSLGEILSQLRPTRPVYFSTTRNGTMQGAAALAGASSEVKSELARQHAQSIDANELRQYRQTWRSHVERMEKDTIQL